MRRHNRPQGLWETTDFTGLDTRFWENSSGETEGVISFLDAFFPPKNTHPRVAFPIYRPPCGQGTLSLSLFSFCASKVGIIVLVVLSSMKGQDPGSKRQPRWLGNRGKAPRMHWGSVPGAREGTGSLMG